MDTVNHEKSPVDGNKPEEMHRDWLMKVNVVSLRTSGA
jgi:hypothetical protein